VTSTYPTIVAIFSAVSTVAADETLDARHPAKQTRWKANKAARSRANHPITRDGVSASGGPLVGVSLNIPSHACARHLLDESDGAAAV